MDWAYASYVLLGCATLAPWNALITAADYWEARYPVSQRLGRRAERTLVCSAPHTADQTARHDAQDGPALLAEAWHSLVLAPFASGLSAPLLTSSPPPLPLQGKHTDRLATISYLPVNLVVIAAMVRCHAVVRPRLRIMSGLLGYTLAISAVPLVSPSCRFPAGSRAAAARRHAEFSEFSMN